MCESEYDAATRDDPLGANANAVIPRPRRRAVPRPPPPPPPSLHGHIRVHEDAHGLGDASRAAGEPPNVPEFDHPVRRAGGDEHLPVVRERD